MLFKNKKLLVGLIIIIAIIAVFWQINYQRKEKTNSGFRNECLKENEEASYEIKEKKRSLGDSEAVATIFIKDKNMNIIKRSFKIDNVWRVADPIEIHKCGVYVIRLFNYDPNKTKQDIGYRDEIWRYNYGGSGTSFILLSEKPKEFVSYYSPIFRVSPDEKYIVLEKGYLGQEDYSLVIKDLKTKENVFVLSANSISKKYPNIVGVFDLLNWSDDNRYFWGSISEGAYVNGYFRIDTQNWKTDIFEAPDGAMGGSDLNINTGYLTIQPGQVWTGFSDIEEELKAQYKKEGKKSSLYIYNLFTKEKLLVAETEEPLWWFEAKWISDTELEYELPTGEKEIYKIKE